VKNTGSAVNRKRFLQLLQPEKLESGVQAGEDRGSGAQRHEQVEVTITPAAQALVGDYSVGVSVDGEKAAIKPLNSGGRLKPPRPGAGSALLYYVVIAGMGGLFLW